MITQPKSLLLQGLQFAQMAAFCMKKSGPQWAAAAAGLSAIVAILWPSSARPHAVTPAQLKADLKQLEQGISAVVWSGFQSNHQADLDAALSEWQSMFEDVASGKLDVDLSTITGQVDAQAWQTVTTKALSYGTWTSANPLPAIWNWAADQAVYQQKVSRPEVTSLQLFPLYSAAANCFLVWAQLGLFVEYDQIKQRAKAASKAGNAKAGVGLPSYPNDNPKSPYFVAQQQALEQFVAYAEGGAVTVKDAAGQPKQVTYPGVLPTVRKGKSALGPAIAKVKSGAAYKSIQPRVSDDGYSYVYTDPDTKTTQPLYNAKTLAEAQTQCDQIKRMRIAQAVAKIEDQHCLNVLTNDQLQTIEDTLTQWKSSLADMKTIARRHHS